MCVCVCVYVKMYPRLYMQTFQYATYDPHREEINFETRHANGRCFRFTLSENQFLALNDAIMMIEKENCYGHFPLGQSTWIHYNAFDASLYRQTKNYGRIDFIFGCFEEYKSFTHRRLFSLIRLKSTTATRRRANDGRGRGRGESSNYKRPSSVVVQSEDQSPATKRSRRGERKTTSRSSDNAFVSDTEKESPILSEWHYSNTRRRCDSISSLSSASESLSAPDIVQIKSPATSTTDSMDIE